MKKLKVELSESIYQIIINKNSILSLVEKINSLPITKCLIIIDENVEKFHSRYLRNYFANLNCKTYKYIYSATEKNKSLQQTQKIYKFLDDNNFDRNSVVISVGGGITGDVSAFASSTFMRGIKYFQVPTTLLSMVDSSVGGKTGVNFERRKNLIGTFYQPSGVFIDETFLGSLPGSELISGAGEIFKYAFLADMKNYLLLKTNLKKIAAFENFNIESTIQNCLKIKASIVSQDEKEITGLRKILNLGHTFAHAFESQSNYKLKHGEAVVAGVFCSLFMSHNLGFFSKQELEHYINDFNFFKINRILKKLKTELVYSSMLGDKKNSSGKIKLVLVEDIGNIITDVVTEKSMIMDSVDKMKELI